MKGLESGGTEFMAIEFLTGIEPIDVVAALIGNETSSFPVVYKHTEAQLCSIRREIEWNRQQVRGCTSGVTRRCLEDVVAMANKMMFINDATEELMKGQMSRGIQSFVAYSRYVLLLVDRYIKASLDPFLKEETWKFMLRLVETHKRVRPIIQWLSSAYNFIETHYDVDLYSLTSQFTYLIHSQLQAVCETKETVLFPFLYGGYVSLILPFLNQCEEFLRGNTRDSFCEFIIYEKDTLVQEDTMIDASEQNMDILEDNASRASVSSVLDKVWSRLTLHNELPPFISRDTARLMLNATKSSVTLSLLSLSINMKAHLSYDVIMKLEDHIKEQLAPCLPVESDTTFNELAFHLIEETEQVTEEILSEAYDKRFPDDVNILMDGCNEDKTDLSHVLCSKHLYELGVVATQCHDIWNTYKQPHLISEPMKALLVDTILFPGQIVDIPCLSLTDITDTLVDKELSLVANRLISQFQHQFLTQFHIKEHFKVLFGTLLLSEPTTTDWFCQSIALPLSIDGQGLVQGDLNMLAREQRKLIQMSECITASIRVEDAVHVFLVDTYSAADIASRWFEINGLSSASKLIHIQPLTSVANLARVVIKYVPKGPFTVMLGETERIAYLELSRIIKARRYVTHIVAHTVVSNQVLREQERNILAHFRHLLHNAMLAIEQFTYYDALTPLLKFGTEIGSNLSIPLWDLVAQHRKILANVLDSVQVGNKAINAQVTHLLNATVYYCTLLNEGVTFAETKRCIRETQTTYNTLLRSLIEVSKQNGKLCPAYWLLQRLPQ